MKWTTIKIMWRAGWTLCLTLMWLWASLAIYYSNLPGENLRMFLAWGFAITVAAAFMVLPNRRTTIIGFLIGFGVIYVWFLLIPASNNRDWNPFVAVLPEVAFEDDLVTISHVRNFDHTNSEDFKVRYYDKTYDLTKLNTLDLFLSYWDGNTMIAHTFLSFGFGGEDYVVISIETRPEKGEEYSAISGFFRRFELFYVVGDERDIVGVRTNHRSEEVYLYPLKLDIDVIRKLFVGMLQRAAALHDHPKWYNAYDRNCTTSIYTDVREILNYDPPFSILMLLNGYIDELLYQRGTIVADVSDGKPFPQMKRLHFISEIAKRNEDAPDFSQKIRGHLPKRNR
ncbi:MAG: DUF4105 domain-containing protein [Nitrospirota bacterium]|nr:MAG: DUF4105 domain-containing protein [Nitrospirota bacterium]